MSDTSVPRADTSGDQSITTYRWLYWIGLALTLALWAILGLLLHGITLDISYSNYSVDLGYLMGVFALLHLIADIRKVPPDFYGCVYFFGWPTIQVSSRWLPVPRLLFSIIFVSRTIIEIEVPTDPEKIWRGDENVPPAQVELGYKPPFRVVFANAPKFDTPPAEGTPERRLYDLARMFPDDDPLHVRSTNEVSWFARIQVREPFDFVANIESRRNAVQQVEDMGSSLINDKLTLMTPAMALHSLTEVSQALESLIREKTKHWGVRVLTARIKQIELSHNFNSAVQDIPEATAEATATVRRAEGNKKAAILRGQGERGAYDARIKDTGISPSQILASQTAVDVSTALANGKGDNAKIILGASGAVSDVLGVIAAATTPKEGA